MSYNYIDLTGVIVPDIAGTGAEVAQEYKNAFGQDLVVTPDTPQGLLVVAETLSRDSVAENNAQLANQINPNLAGGVFLDALLALTGEERTPETFSFVVAQLAGDPTTVIAAGVLTEDTAGFQWALETETTLDGSGEATATFQCTIPGSIALAPGNLTQIVTTGINGWDTVDNADAATPGSLTQSDEQARLVRKNTLALQGNGIAEAIVSRLNALPAIRSVSFRENPTSVTEIIDGVTLLPHSMWAAVEGGTDDEVANVLNNVKSAGCNYNGNVIVPIVDPYSGQSIDVKFDRPEVVNILARVTVSADSSVSDPVQSVKAAIVAYANGLVDGQDGFVLGADVSPFEMAGAVSCLFPGIFVSLLEVTKLVPLNYVTSTIPIEVYELPRIDASSIQVILT